MRSKFLRKYQCLCLTVRNTGDMQSVAQQFIQAIAQHHHWMREHK
ncbi:MAG: hypothetical protein AB1589_21340 [Cyanobacteriota bacterium]